MADEFIRPSGDTTLDGWTDEAGGTTTIYTKIDESTAGDSDFVQSPTITVGQADLKVRLLQGSTQIAEWIHSNISETFADAAQTLSAPELASISDFNDLNIELDDNAGSVYKFALGNPTAALTTPVVVRYRYKKLIEVVGGAATTWSTTDKSGNIGLSGSDLVATHLGPTTAASGRAAAGQSAGQWYWEVVLTSEVSGPGEIFIGLAISSAGVGSYVGFAANTIGIGNQESVWRAGSSLGADTGSLSSGENIGIAWDKTNGKIHFRLSGGDWNGNSGDNPATNTGGYDISAFSAGTYMPAYTMSTEDDAITAKFSSSSWAYAAPSGFLQLSAS